MSPPIPMFIGSVTHNMAAAATAASAALPPRSSMRNAARVARELLVATITLAPTAGGRFTEDVNLVVVLATGSDHAWGVVGESAGGMQPTWRTMRLPWYRVADVT